MKKMIDERIERARQDVYAQSFFLLMGGMGVIFLYRFFILHQAYSNFRDFALLLVIVLIYSNFASVAKGIKPPITKKSKLRFLPWLTGIFMAMALVISVVLQEWNGTPIWLIAITAIALIVGCVFGVYFSIWINNRLFRRWEKHNLGQSSEEE